MKKNVRLLTRFVLVLSLPLLFGGAAGAQDKLQKCSNIVISVDVNKSAGNWDRAAYILRLQGEREGWTISEPADQRGGNIKAGPGTKLRFNISDGANHPVDVKANTGEGKALTVSEGSHAAIVLVDVGRSGSKTGSVHFEITGAKNPNAKINGCPGGNFYIDLQ